MIKQLFPTHGLRTAAFAALLFLAGGTACAKDTTPEAGENTRAKPAQSQAKVEIASGAQTNEWLQQQGTRQQASKNRQTMSGPVMEKVYERYVRSFEASIKESVRDTSAIAPQQQQ